MKINENLNRAHKFSNLNESYLKEQCVITTFNRDLRAAVDPIKRPLEELFGGYFKRECAVRKEENVCERKCRHRKWKLIDEARLQLGETNVTGSKCV